MKKILTASLVAMMAVTAANAEIASVEYVGEKTGFVSENGNLTTAVNTLAGRLSTEEGKVDNDTKYFAGTNISLAEDDVTFNVATANGETLGVVKAGTNVSIVNGAVSVADGTTSAKGVVQLTDSITTTDSTKAITGKAIDSLDASDEAVNGHYVSAVSQEDGKISVTRAALPTDNDTKYFAGTNISLAEDDVTFNVATANGETLGVVKAGTNVSIVNGAVSVADGTTSAKGVVQLTDSITTTDSTKAITGKAIDSLDGKTGTANAATGSYVMEVTQADGVVTKTSYNFSKSISESDQNAPTGGAVFSYVKDQITENNTDLDDRFGDIEKDYVRGGKNFAGATIGDLPDACKAGNAKCSLVSSASADGKSFSLSWELVRY